NEEGLPRLMQLEQKLFDAIKPDRREEAEEALDIGRLSWRLRDDDNLLLNRIESQLLRALEEGAYRLKKSGRLKANIEVNAEDAKKIIHALRNSEITEVILPQKNAEKYDEKKTSLHEKPRQLVGQPAAPGIITGKVRCIRDTADLGKFCRGEILVCDAIQPNMTHLVPLASAIIERRGGMLIHGAIIAREMGIPCVNGIPKVIELFNNGDVVTVDGNLGIVTIGEPEFELELNIR
ncbi:pyruvate phosphate dikinase PEP/pyruvate-binding protein, partial [candidate division KSB1 bacterium]|nr:pyruvate phosphate dikinase PEP/pyruvate-binding protein [candidate division KSB1 bacterium]